MMTTILPPEALNEAVIDGRYRLDHDGAAVKKGFMTSLTLYLQLSSRAHCAGFQ